MSPSFARWLRGLKSNLLGPRRTAPRPVSRSARAPRLGIEALEDRVVPAVHTWTDGSLVDNNWSTPANWDAAGVPTTGEAGGTIVVFPTGDPTSIVDAGVTGLVINRIDFTSSGNVITLNTPLGFNGALGNQLTNSTGTNTITGSSIALTVGPAFLDVAAGTVTIASAITGAQGIRKSGPGTLALTTATPSTYTGTTNIADGVLLLNTNTVGDAGLGQSTLIVVGDLIGAAGSAVLRLPGTFEIQDTAAVTINTDGLVDVTATGTEDVTTLNVNGGRVAIAAGGTFEIQPGGTVASNGAAGSQITGGGNFRLQNGTVTFNVADGAARTDLLVATSITQVTAANLTKTGAGVLTLAGWNAYTGTTTISAGTLEVTNGVSGPVSVAGGTLAGNGTVGAVTGTGGTVAPGMGDSTQTLSTGNLTLGGATFAPTISGTLSDRLNVTGTVNLNGSTLSPTATGPGALATASYTLISNDGTDPVVGTFNGLAQGAIVTLGGQSFVLSYTGGDGNDVTLTPTVYTGAFMFGDFLILLGAGFPGGFAFLRLPPGSNATFADVTGDGYGDVVLFLPTLALAVDGATGRFALLSSDLNGDGFRELQIFNLDGTTTTIDGKTGVSMTK